MKGYFWTFGVINEEMKCYEIGIEAKKGMDYKIPEDFRMKEIWTIGALKYCLNLLHRHFVEEGIQFCSFPELRLKE